MMTALRPTTAAAIRTTVKLDEKESAKRAEKNRSSEDLTQKVADVSISSTNGSSRRTRSSRRLSLSLSSSARDEIRNSEASVPNAEPSPNSDSSSHSNRSTDANGSDSEGSSSSQSRRRRSGKGLFDLLRDTIAPSPSPVRSQTPVRVPAAAAVAASPVVVSAPPMSQDEALLQAIVLDQDFLCDALCLFNDSIISSEKLFSLILSELQQLPAIAKEEKVNRVVDLLNFCSRWMRKNIGTIPFKKASRKLVEIIVACQDHKAPAISKVATSLLRLCDKPMAAELQFAYEEPKVKPEFASVYTKEAASCPFGSYLKDLLDPTESSESKLQSYAAQIATDLTAYQKEIYLAIDPHDLVKKWEKEPLSLTRGTQFLNGLVHFVASTILSYPRESDRVMIIRFFLRIAKIALANNDFMTPRGIYAGFEIGAVSRLRATWRRVEEAPEIEAYNQLLTSNFEGLRKRQAGCRKFIPFLSVLYQDFAFLKEKGATITENNVTRYNLAKILQYRALIIATFSCQGNWHQDPVAKVPNSDAVFCCLKPPVGFLPKVLPADVGNLEEYYYYLSDQHEPPAPKPAS